jgi:hypothetical protein
VFICNSTPLPAIFDSSEPFLQTGFINQTSPSASSQKALSSSTTTDLCKGFPKLPKGDGTQQNKTGYCSNVEVGSIPSADLMVSTLITSPEDDSVIPLGTPFTVKYDILNMELGHYSDPSKEFQSEPQKLNDKGLVMGHSHVTIQKIGESKNEPLKAPDARQLTFFKELDLKSTDGRTLTLEVPGINKSGLYRLCSLTSSRTHQPVHMPLARRGSQDDCIRFIVS